MCDYSLAHYPNRLAVEGEQLVVHRFPSGTVGLASSGQEMSSSSQNPKRSACNCAVCVPPGAQLRLHDIPEHIQTSLGVGAVEEVMFVERSAEAFVHRDAVGFGNGRQVLLQYLHVGQRVDVLSLSSGCDGGGEHKNQMREDEDRHVVVGSTRLRFIARVGLARTSSYLAGLFRPGLPLLERKGP